MGKVNYKKVFAIKKANEKKILSVNPNIPHSSGIYFLTRVDENGINYFYIGQSVDILDRMISHMSGYQHIDISLRKRNFYSEKNPYGWKLNFKEYPKEQLDEMEQHWILEYTKGGYQARYNKTSGSQGEGKEKINEFKPSKTYRDGLEQGRKNVSKELSHLFELHLDVTTKKNPPTVNQQKALDKFNELLEYHKNEGE